MVGIIIVLIVFGLLFVSVCVNIIKISRQVDDPYDKLERKENPNQGTTEPVKVEPPADQFRENVAIPYIIDNYGKVSQREMSRYLNISRSTVRNWIKKLIKDGRITQISCENK